MCLLLAIGFVFLPSKLEILKGLVALTTGLVFTTLKLLRALCPFTLITALGRLIAVVLFGWPSRERYGRENMRCAGITVGKVQCTRTVKGVEEGEVPACASHKIQQDWLRANT